MGSERQIRGTIDTISAATVGEAEWRDVSRSLVDLIGATTHSLWLGKPSTGQIEILSTSFDRTVNNSYAEYYHQFDFWTNRAIARRSTSAILGTDLVTAEDMRKSESYADFYRPNGMSHVAGAAVPLGGSAAFMALGLHRPDRSRGFTEQDRATVNQVLPCLRRGIRLRYELKMATGAAEAAMSGLAAMNVAALAVDANNRILFANATAAALLQAGRGLVSRAGRCVAADPADAPALEALVEKAASGSIGGLLRLRARSGAAPLTLMAARPALADRPGVALLFLLDPAADHSKAKGHLLQAMHGLTVAESDVAEAAARGEAAVSIAARRGTSEATVRAQLRLVLEKTEARNLRAFAAMLAALPNMPV